MMSAAVKCNIKQIKDLVAAHLPTDFFKRYHQKLKNTV